MGLFGKLVRSRQQPRSELGDFLVKLTPGAIRSQSLAAKEPAMRIATAIALLILAQSARFARDLFATLAKPPVPVTTPLDGAARFDAVVFETAAFVHYALLAKHLNSPSDDLGDEDRSHDDDPYFAAGRDSSLLTGSILSSLAAFDVNEEVFANRPIAYSMRAPRQSFIEMFEGILIQAIDRAAPAALRSDGVCLDLGLSLVVPMHVRAFATAMLPEFEQAVRNACDNASELGFD